MSVTDPLKAAEVQAHWEMGYSASEAARMAGIPDRTARGIVRNEGLKTRLAETRHAIKAELQAESMVIARLCQAQVKKTIEKASAYQAAGIYGLFRTHERLDAGEPTEITASVNVHIEAKVDAVVEALSRALLLKAQEKQEVIDITPEPNKIR